MSWSSDRTDFDRNIAVVIGINNYQNGIHPLKTAVNDARAIADILEQEYEYQEVIRLFSEHGEATLAEINQLLFETLPNKIQPTEGDRLVFYFAGHGIARNSEDGPAGYLVPQDAQSGKLETFLPMRKLNEALSKLDCHHLLVILDCCFAGNFRWSSSRNVISALETIHREHYDRFIRYPAWQAITSAAHNQEALDYTDERGIDKDSLHSPFAKALINGLKDMKADLTGDKVITAPELYLYLRDSLISKDGYSELQTAGLWPLQKHDRGEFIFTLPGFVREELKPAPPLDENNNPYRGLQSFDEKHARFFFGRQQLVNQLSVRVSRPVSRLEQRLTVVLGISGSGKSSLVKAGLISHLRKATNSFEFTLIYACIITLAILEVSPDIPVKFLPISYAHQWEILEPMRPGESPFNALAKAILPLVETQDKLADNLKENPEYLSKILSTWSQTNSDRKLLLAIDQFEELITMSRQVNPTSNQSEQKDDIQKQFLALLVNAIKNCPQLHIVLTLRSDFEPRFIQSALKEYWTEARFPVRAMNLDELRQAIEQPAAEMALYFEPANLVNQLIDEVSQMPGALPLLSFTLSELYIKLHQAWVKDGKKERALTVDERFYKQGGIAGSLSRTANKIYNSLPDNAHRDTMRRVMLRMVALEGGEPVRRRVPLSELNYASKQEPTQLNEEENQRVKVVLESLDKARLVVSGQETGEAYVEPAHDFLVKGWDKLQKWQEEEQENLLLQRRLTPAALEWKNKEQPSSLLAKTEPFLMRLDKKIDLTQDWLKQIQEKDIQQLLQEARVQLQSATLEEKSQKQPSSFVRKTEPFLSLLDKTLGFAEDWLIKVRQDNNQERPREKKVQFLWNGNPYLDVLRKTLKSRDYWFNQVEAEFVQQSIWQKRRNVNLRWFLASAAIIVSSSLTVWALIGQKQALIEQINANQNSSEIELRTNQPTLEALISSLRAGKSLKHWLLHTSILPPQIDQQQQNQVITTLRKALYQVRELNRWQLPEGKVLDIFFSQDGQIFVAIQKDENDVCIWDSQTKACNPLPRQDLIIVAKFSPNGKILAILSQNQIGKDKAARLWNLESKQFEYELLGLQGPESLKDQRRGANISFSHDGKRLAIEIERGNSSGKYGYLWWNLEDKQPYILQYDRILGMTFKPNGHLLIATLQGINNSQYNPYVAVINWPSGQVSFFSPTAEIPDSIHNVNFSTNGEQITFVSGADFFGSEMWRWDLNKKQWINVEPQSLNQVDKSRFSVDGELLVAANRNTVHLYKLGSGAVLSKFNLPQGAVENMTFSSDGEQFITQSDDGILRLWSTDLPYPKTEPKFSLEGIESISFNPNGQTIATIATDSQGTVRLWDLVGNQLQEFLKVPGKIASLSFSSNGKQLATGGEDGFVRFWDLHGNILKEFKPYPNNRVKIIGWAQNGQSIATIKIDKSNKNTIKDTVVHLWSLNGQKLGEFTVPFNEPSVGSIHFQSNGTLKAIYTHGGGDIVLWDSSGKSTTLNTKNIGDTFLRSSINFNADGNLFATTSGSGVAIWDLQGEQLMKFEGHINRIISVSFSADDSKLAAVGDDGKVQLWQLGGLDELLQRLATLDEKNSDRHLCDGIGNSLP